MKRGQDIRNLRLTRQPFWLAGPNYYVFAAAVSIAFFFVAWGILRDEEDQMPWITAGIGASILLGGAAVLREIVLRRARSRGVLMERRINDSFTGARRQLGDRRSTGKLTLEKNASILGTIEQKSAAAKVLSKFPDGHREVFELCGEYLARVETELTTVSAGSPRLSALLKGRKTAASLHRSHLLQWAEIEARSLSAEATTLSDVSERLRSAHDALNVIDFALQAYPTDESLLGSRVVLRELAVSIKVSDLVESAERAAFGKSHREALGLYRDALFYLGRDNVHTDERQRMADRINAEMERLRLLEGGE